MKSSLAKGAENEVYTGDKDEITAYMQALGFEMDYYDEYHNSDYDVFDAVPNNVLYGIDGDLYFIDTQIRLRI